MGDTFQTIDVEQGGQVGSVRFPAEWKPAQVDQELLGSGLVRAGQHPVAASAEPRRQDGWFTPVGTPKGGSDIRQLGPFKVDIGKGPVLNYFSNMTPVEAGIFTASMGAGAIAGKALGMTATELAASGLAKRAAAGLIRTGTTLAGAEAGAAYEQMTEEKPTGYAAAGANALMVSMLGEGGQALMNKMGTSLIGMYKGAFSDPREWLEFIKRWVPEFQNIQSSSELVNAAFRGKLEIAANQKIQQAVGRAVSRSDASVLSLPELGAEAERLKIPQFMKMNRQQGSVGQDLFTPQEAMDFHGFLGTYTGTEGQPLSSQIAKRIQGVRDYSHSLMESQMGKSAIAEWDAGRGTYGLYSELNRLMAQAKSFKFQDLQKVVIDRYKGDSGAQKLLGSAFNDLLETVFRRGAQIADKPGYMPFTRVHPSGGFSTGIPTLPQKTGVLPPIPQGMGQPLAAVAQEQGLIPSLGP